MVLGPGLISQPAARSGLPSSSGSKPSSANSQKTTRKFHMQQEIKQLSRITDFLTRDNCYKMLQNYFRLVLLNNGTEDLSSKESQFFFHSSTTKFSLPQNNEITSETVAEASEHTGFSWLGKLPEADLLKASEESQLLENYTLTLFGP